jgi:hypothetical protein
MLRKPFRADYTFTIEGNVIAIVDLDLGSKSVTNDIENVIEDIRAELGDLAGYAIIYRDSTGRWDGVRLINSQAGFPIVHFYALNEREQHQAQARLLHVIE